MYDRLNRELLDKYAEKQRVIKTSNNYESRMVSEARGWCRAIEWFMNKKDETHE